MILHHNKAYRKQTNCDLIFRLAVKKIVCKCLHNIGHTFWPSNMYLSYYPYPIISFSDTLHIGSLFSPYYTAHNTHEDLASPSWPHFPHYPCNNNRSIHCTWFLVVGLHMGKHHGHLQIILQAKMFVSLVDVEEVDIQVTQHRVTNQTKLLIVEMML